MTDNTEDEHLDTPPDTQPENPSEEIIPAADTETIKPNQENENMEVHHHTHAQHGKKTWKNYIWEFLMLFLAVFCGFLAEWKLEHVIEHSREHEYMESMIVDIKTDETNLSGMKSIFAYVSSHIDSLIPLLQDQEQLDMNAAKIYQHQVYLNLFQKWIYADRTIDQLKNSGTFRLIRNRLVSDRIIEYDGIIRNNIRDMQLNLLQKQSQGIIEAGTDIFKSSVFKEYYMNGGFSYHPVVLPKAPYFLTHNEITLQKFISKLDQYSVSIDWFKSFIEIAIKKGNQVDSLIKKEYHIE